jgi:hypothetical protein
MNKLTCRGCGKELENCTCNVLTTKKEQTEKLKLIGKDEMLCVSLPFGWCFDEVKDLIEASCIFQLDADQLVVDNLQARIKDLEAINESHHKENDRLNKRIEELEELIPTKDEAEYTIKMHYYHNCGALREGNQLNVMDDCRRTGCKFYLIRAKLQKIIDKRG